MQGAHFQILFADFEAFLHSVFLAVEGQHFRIRQVGVIGDQEKTAIVAFGGLQGIGIDPPSQVDLAGGRGDLHADPFSRRRMFQLSGDPPGDFQLTAVAFLSDLGLDLLESEQEFADILPAFLTQHLAHRIRADHQAAMRNGPSHG